MIIFFNISVCVRDRKHRVCTSDGEIPAIMIFQPKILPRVPHVTTDSLFHRRVNTKRARFPHKSQSRPALSVARTILYCRGEARQNAEQTRRKTGNGWQEREEKRKTSGEESLGCIYRASINQLTWGYANIANTRRAWRDDWQTLALVRRDDVWVWRARRGRCIWTAMKDRYNLMATRKRYKQYPHQLASRLAISIEISHLTKLWFLITKILFETNIFFFLCFFLLHRYQKVIVSN